MRFFKISFPLCFATLLMVGCSTKKDALVNRKWHALNTEYNVLYNGKEALIDGKETLIRSFTDNYWETLPVERLEIREEIRIPGAENNPNFERAEEKAAKAIQKHGMNIKGNEKNPQIDEAYLLLGKARYYDQRFIPAIEAFNYILYKYPQSDIINQAKIWREKTNIRIENNELALKNLKRLLRQEKVEGQDYADATAMMAQAYINLKHKDSAVQKLKVASVYTPNNEERGRYYYIIGQLYNELGHKDSANYAFDKVIGLNRKSPRIYMINAYVEKTRNFDADKGDKQMLFELLTDLEENRENRPFLDKIYREKAMFFLREDSINAATTYFNKSLRAESNDKVLRSLNYENLAQIMFDVSQYKEAGAYYDSTLTDIGQHTKKFRVLTKKRENLADIIKYEDIVKKNDSILYVVSLNKEEKEAYFQAYIDSLKAMDEDKAEKNRIKTLQSGVAGPTFGNTLSKNNQKEAAFYFYNPTTVSYGINEFKRIWGERVLEDNWRLADKSVISIAQATISQDNTTIGTEDRYSLDFYIDQLPTSKSSIDSIAKERNFANYQLGVIYLEKFGEHQMAANRLESVLKNNPEEKLVLPSKYNLYKIYNLSGSPLADRIKTDIILNYADSRYAEILKNPQVVLTEDENSPDVIYARLYKQFEEQQYERVLEEAGNYIDKFNGEEIAPKFEMLKASAMARLNGLKAYEEVLNYIALNYPNKQEGKEAQNIIDTTLPRLRDKTILADSISATSWNLVYPFLKSDNKGIDKLFGTVQRSLKELNYTKLSVSKDVYDQDKLFVVVHGLISKERALGYAELLNINKDYLVTNDNFVISSPNYKIIQIHKNLEEYLTQINNPNLNN